MGGVVSMEEFQRKFFYNSVYQVSYKVLYFGAAYISNQ